MWKSALCVTVLLFGCKRSEPIDEVALPKVAPDTVVVSWSVISRSSDRSSLHAVIHADRSLVVTTRDVTGTMMTVSRSVPEKEYAKLIASLRAQDCCSLPSTSRERLSPNEAKPRLEIDLGDVQCEIELWDGEWLQGRARECGFAVARAHAGGFVPDPPVDATPP